jgi:hypothetical protein
MVMVYVSCLLSCIPSALQAGSRSGPDKPGLLLLLLLLQWQQLSRSCRKLRIAGCQQTTAGDSTQQPSNTAVRLQAAVTTAAAA